MKARLYIILMLGVAFSKYGIAQENHLEKLISLELTSKKINEVLSKMEEKGNFYFSYDAEIVPIDSVVSVQVNNREVRDILQKLLPSRLNYKSVGNHVVIFSKAKDKKQPIIISGHITDGRNNSPLANATIYEPGNNLIASTDANGYYEMSISQEADRLGITASKSGYKQEVIYVNPLSAGNLDFKLLKEEKKVENLNSKPLDYPDVDERALVKLMVPQRVMDNADNLTLFEKAQTQISFLPGLGTAGLLNGSTTNKLSLNVLGGYSQATDGLELGGLLNINRQDMIGCQLAGVGNITGRFVKGFQAAGMLNFNGLDLNGVQMAGFSNINGGELKGWQVAGFSNVLNGKLEGIQMSGFSNVALEDVDGFQVSGFSNVAAERITKLQLSGFTNYAKVNEGVQLSGFFNYVQSNKRFQISVINYADSSSGVSFGLVSYVRHGYHVWEISGTETFPVNMSFRSGVKRFYNIFEAGVGNNVFRATYGVGTMPSLGRKLDLSMDLTGSTVFYAQNPDWDYLPYMARFDVMLNIQAKPKFAIAIGPSISYYVQPLNPEKQINKLSSYQFYERTSDSWYHQAWIGGKLALRFF